MNPENNIHLFGKRISQHKPVTIPGKSLFQRACTTLLLQQHEIEDEIYMLMVKRAKRLGDPWSGHISLPGGKMERGDKNGFSAASRELLEETGIDARQGEYVGKLSDLFTKSHNNMFPMIITPYIFIFNSYVSLDFINEDEVDEVFKLPLSFLLKKENRKKMKHKVAGKKFNIPCYDYGEKRIWGLTLMMLDELVDIYLHKKTSYLKWFSRLIAYE